MDASTSTLPAPPPVPVEILYRAYTNEDDDLPHIQRLVESELSEPYTIYTYRYFLHQWPHLAFLAYPSNGSPKEPIALIVCKQDLHRYKTNRGYIAMLSVDKQWRKRRIASKLVDLALEAMKNDGAEQIVLETEHDNAAALSLYESLGFIREKRLYRFYLNGKDAFRLLLPLPPPAPSPLLVAPSSSTTASQPDTPLLIRQPSSSSSSDACAPPKLPPRPDVAPSDLPEAPPQQPWIGRAEEDELEGLEERMESMRRGFAADAEGFES